MSRSDKDIESLVMVKLLTGLEVSQEQLEEAAGGRLTAKRIDRIKERIQKTTTKLTERFSKNIERRGLS